MASDTYLWEEDALLALSQEKLPKRVKGSEEQKLSSWRTCLDVSLLQFTSCECEENTVVSEKQASLPDGMDSNVQGYSAYEIVETLRQFWD